MKYVKLPAADGQVIQIRKSGKYWMNRAQEHRRAGNHRRAAALLRHAVRESPQDVDLRLEYAEVLQDMECYEASTREAFLAMAADPARFTGYGLIGRNMMALGLQTEALDAFSRYLEGVRSVGATPDWEDDIDAVEFAYYREDPANVARYQALMASAGRRLARGDNDEAARLLKRASRMHGVDERYYCLKSLLEQARERYAAAIVSARDAVRRSPGSLQALCALAGAESGAGHRSRTAAALMAAQYRCRGTQEEQLCAYTCVTLGFPELAAMLLKRAAKRSPNRLPTLYDQCVTLLYMGRVDEAEPLIHLCRDLDPYDVPSQCTHHLIEEFREKGASREEIAARASKLPYYPLIDADEINARLAVLSAPLSEGVEAFCERLTADEAFYRLFLYVLGMPNSGLGRLLALIATNLPMDFAQRLLREVLVQASPDDGVKRYALSALVMLGAKPPFVVWQEGRIAELDPTFSQSRANDFLRKTLAQRLAAIGRRAQDPRVTTQVYGMLSRLNERVLMRVLQDDDGIYSAALEQQALRALKLADSAHVKHIAGRSSKARRLLAEAVRALEKGQGQG